ncbi:MAG: SMI1/KNR4 family protein [Planctomycetota bacterium]
MSECLADWWDSEIWRHTGHGEYRNPVSPDVLLDAAPECIWPGLMDCDFIPLLGNSAGDWLCVRVDEKGNTDQIVQWYHGGGDWIPWGNSLSEALVFDAITDRLPGPTRRHAEPAEDPRPVTGGSQTDALLAWAFEHQPGRVRDLLNTDTSGDVLAGELLDLGVAEIAIRCELAIQHLTHPDRDGLQSALDGQAKSDVRPEWLFDIDRIPQSQRQQLIDQGIDMDWNQRWDLAHDAAQPVTKLAPWLAWPWDVCGYAAERRGDRKDAADFYQQGAMCSVFTDQSIRLLTHWASDHAAKFSVARLQGFDPDRVTQSSYLRTLLGPDVQQRRGAVSEYWLGEAATHESQKDFHALHQCLIASAWDVGVDTIQAYAPLLERISQAAIDSNQLARAEVAATHRRCLRDRYGL